MHSEKQLQQVFNLSVNAIKDRIKHLKLVPTKGDRGKNLYSDEQVRLLKAQHEHLASGGSLASFATPVSAEIVPVGTDKLAVVKQKPNAGAFRQPSAGDSAKPNDNFAQIFTDFQFSDPFYDYESLQRAADKGWHLPTEKLAVIINKSPSTFCRFKSFIHQGFVIVRQSGRSGNSYLWCVNANQ